jgi:hypothetical protein
LQKHGHRAEHWVVVRGTAEVTIGDQIHEVHENESVYIPIGSGHRMANRGKIPLELIELQTGSHLGEDDIERLEDVSISAVERWTLGQERISAATCPRKFLSTSIARSRNELANDCSYKNCCIEPQ